MDSHFLINKITKTFSYPPTKGQEDLIAKLASFILKPQRNALFLLTGYAGTGKTSIVSSLVKALPDIKQNSVLLAPTGRAAKVLSNYAGKKAHTIHRFIYWASRDQEGKFILALRKNKYKNAIFIVDEASMIPDYQNNSNFQSQSRRSLLEDLFTHVYSSDTNCKIVLIGDNAQLPPVGFDESPALEIDYLKASYGVDLDSYCLTEVVRQALESGILFNATNLRKQIALSTFEFPLFHLKNYNDVTPVFGDELEDFLNTAYADEGLENTVIITRSNKRANLFNQQIRHRILYHEDEISSGDYLMIVKNNYYWLAENSNIGFIANGDIVEIASIQKREEMYGFQFADITMRLIDYPDEPQIDVKILLDTIMSESPALNQAQSNKLYEEVMKDYEDIPQKRKRLAELKKNPYFNALQVKFSYALTCHKTQGGQWPIVFIDQGYVSDQMLNNEFLKWMYTAVTRSSKQLYFINFEERFFSD